MERYILKVSYNGNNYSGFQVQNDKDTIEKRLEDALTQVCKQDIKVIASGRTDAGVSALCQVCHFDVDGEISEHKVISYANALLPKDIRILEIIHTTYDFHSRFNAKKKTYEYYFYEGMENSLYEAHATHIGIKIDIDAMQEACTYFVGEHDFSAFCASNTDVKDKVRIVYACKITEVNSGLYKLTICGNGFLYNMVRIIMGTIAMVGLGKILPKDIENIINGKDRNKAGKTMPSKGLILKNVEY